MLTVNELIVNAANEGIPVAAIARVTHSPLDHTYDVLKEARERGAIVDIPKADWPPGAKVSSRLPMVPLPADDDLAFSCRKAFKLTALEAGFLVVLLKNQQVQKLRLHNVVEQQRMTRSSQPDKMDSTDPKMVDVIICKMRKKLKAVDKDIQIATIWGGGYHIEADMKPRIIAHLNGEPHAPQEDASSPTALELGAAARAAGPTVY